MTEKELDRLLLDCWTAIFEASFTEDGLDGSSAALLLERIAAICPSARRLAEEIARKPAI